MNEEYWREKKADEEKKAKEDALWEECKKDPEWFSMKMAALREREIIQKKVNVDIDGRRKAEADSLHSCRNLTMESESGRTQEIVMGCSYH